MTATPDELSVSSVKLFESVPVVVSLTPHVPPTSGTIFPPAPNVLDTLTETLAPFANDSVSDVLVPTVVLSVYWTKLWDPGGAYAQDDVLGIDIP